MHTSPFTPMNLYITACLTMLNRMKLYAYFILYGGNIEESILAKPLFKICRIYYNLFELALFHNYR